MRPFDVARDAGHVRLLWVLNPDIPLLVLLPPATLHSVPTLAALAACALRRDLRTQLDALQTEAAEAAARAVPRRLGSEWGWAVSQPASRESSLHGGGAAAAAALSAAAPAGQGGLGLAVPPGSSVPAPAHQRRRSRGSFCSGSWAGAGGTLATAAAAAAEGPPPLPRASGSLQHGASLRAAAGAGGPTTPPAGSLKGSSHTQGALALAASSVTSNSGCPICMDSRVNVRIGGCGHLLCTDCARQLCAAQEAGPPLCPLCRGVMAGFSLAWRW